MKWEDYGMGKQEKHILQNNSQGTEKKKINQEKQVDWIEAMKNMNYKGIEVAPQ
jgi:hypothetical protein